MPLEYLLSSASVQVRLPGEEVRQVPLAIFEQLSVAFEFQQAWTDLHPIGFCMGTRGFTRSGIRSPGADVVVMQTESAVVPHGR
ncbi:hypothetical protein [Nocardia niwae]|uniref:hypothetical protein n=1 Tax=Nocardia niwae TaxID=626084 RepID=UPI0007A37CC4|nr:hypothetical protein [Nocardia niwae]